MAGHGQLAHGRLELRERRNSYRRNLRQCLLGTEHKIEQSNINRTQDRAVTTTVTKAIIITKERRRALL